MIIISINNESDAGIYVLECSVEELAPGNEDAESKDSVSPNEDVVDDDGIKRR